MPCRYRNEATLRRASGEVLPLYAGANAPHDLYVLKDGGGRAFSRTLARAFE